METILNMETHMETHIPEELYKKLVEYDKDIGEVLPFTDTLRTIFSHNIQPTIFNAMNEVEILTVAKRLRKATTYHIPYETVKERLERIRELGLVFYPILVSKIYSGFSHKHFPTNRFEPGTMIYGAVSYDPKYAEEFVKASLGQNVDHDKIGELLGYPKCDRDFFIKYWAKPDYDPIPIIAVNTEGVRVRELEFDNGHKAIVIDVHGYWENNILLRYCGIRMIPHFPHSFRCKEAKEFSKIFQETMKEYDPEAYQFYKKVLSSYTEWDSMRGVVEVRNRYVWCTANTYPRKNRIIIRYYPE